VVQTLEVVVESTKLMPIADCDWSSDLLLFVAAMFSRNQKRLFACLRGGRLSRLGHCESYDLFRCLSVPPELRRA
jgi:hypothetical protein